MEALLCKNLDKYIEVFMRNLEAMTLLTTYWILERTIRLASQFKRLSKNHKILLSLAENFIMIIQSTILTTHKTLKVRV
jgi:hypothetical protein